jgi:hypothetical protein
VTRSEYNVEWKLRFEERMALILEDSRYKTGQRPATEADEMQARREAGEMMDELERAERERQL